MALLVGPLTENEWPAARELFHRAFMDEPWNVVMYGEPLLERWGGSWDLYSTLRSEDYTLTVGARIGGVLAGALIGSNPGHCHVCEVLVNEPRPADQLLDLDWQFHQNIAEVHAPLGAHAWVTKVAVEPALSGLGIGRRLLESTAAALAAHAPAELILECAPNRVSFYTGLGFEEVGTFADPSGPDCSMMRLWVGGAPTSSQERPDSV
jgi:ribosomal protein S18 acetylase RimI-like enzyme